MNKRKRFKELVDDINQKRKDDFSARYTISNLIYLSLPALLIALVIISCFFTVFLSLFLVYFVLPMLYAVDKRLRASITKIGKREGTYKAGYDDFFGSYLGSVFGMITSIITFILLSFLFLMIFNGCFNPLMNMSEESMSHYKVITEALESKKNEISIVNLLQDNIPYLYKPLIIYSSIVFFLPCLYLFMYKICSNLSAHHMASIILPDIDKNIAASYQENMVKSSIKRYYFVDNCKLNMYYNWPYYLSFTILYALFTYVFYNFSASNYYVTILFIAMFFALIVFSSIILDYFVMKNEYYILERLSSDLIDRFPETLKMQIKNIYSSKGYIYGEESAIRGAFVPSSNYDVESDDNNNNEIKSEEDKKDIVIEKITSSVVDLSSDENSNC